MTPAQLHKRCKVTNLEWLMNWPWERITGRVQYPDLVQLDENVTMSTEVRNLRDTYLGMQALCSNIAEAGFRWEQVDGWDISIQFRENPQVIIGGSRAKFNPGVSGCVSLFNISIREFLGCLILAVCASIPIIQFVLKTMAMDKAGEQGADLMWMIIGAGAIAVFGYFCEGLVAVHKGMSLTDRVG
jgi:hypothetical protein